MKKIRRRMVQFITFDLQLQYEHIERLFVTVQHNEQQGYTDWSVQATLKKMVSHYWCKWTDNSVQPNLYNMASLSASPFRTDK